MNNCKNCRNAQEVGMKSLPTNGVCWCEKLKTYICIPNFRCSEYQQDDSQETKGSCKVCDSDNVEYGDIDFETESELYQKCFCQDCESEWNERYEYFGTEITYNSRDKK